MDVIDWDSPKSALLSLASIVEHNMGGSSGAVSLPAMQHSVCCAHKPTWLCVCILADLQSLPDCWSQRSVLMVRPNVVDCGSAGRATGHYEVCGSRMLQALAVQWPAILFAMMGHVLNSNCVLATTRSP